MPACVVCAYEGEEVKKGEDFGGGGGGVAALVYLESVPRTALSLTVGVARVNECAVACLRVRWAKRRHLSLKVLLILIHNGNLCVGDRGCWVCERVNV
jgi:hypothetical protein